MTRAIEIHSARVFLAEAARRRTFNGMHANLLRWAANARKRAMAPAEPIDQPDLFSCQISSHHGVSK